jgi:nucleotide-binding universal stress UspA family protein
MRVLWAIPDSSQLGRRMHTAPQLLSSLRRSATQPSLHVEPLLLAHDRHDLPMRLDENEEEYSKLLVAHWNRCIARYELPELAPPRVIFPTDTRCKTAVKCLAQYAAGHCFDVIVVGAEDFKGLRCWLGGNFAARLLRFSSVPMIVVTPRTHPMHAVSAVLFASDLSDESRRAFAAVLRLASALRCRVILYHASHHRSDLAHVDRMVGEARASDVEIDARVEPPARSIASAILSQAESLAPALPLLALAHRSSAWRSGLRGSITREVLRRTICPLWMVTARLLQSAAPLSAETARRRVGGG